VLADHRGVTMFELVWSSWIAATQRLQKNRATGWTGWKCHRRRVAFRPLHGMAARDLVLICGVFGNIADDDIEQNRRLLPQLCAPAALSSGRAIGGRQTGCR